MGTVKSFPIYKKRHASGNLGYRVDMGIVRGKRTFKSFTSEEKAQRFQRSCLEAAAKERPVDLQELDDISRHEVLAALSKLKAHGANITNDVDFFLKHNHPEKPDATIGDLMAKFKELCAVIQYPGRPVIYFSSFCLRRPSGQSNHTFLATCNHQLKCSDFGHYTYFKITESI